MAEETYAFIVGDLVVNTAVFDSPDEALLETFREHHSADQVIPCLAAVTPGCTWDGEHFIPEKPWPSWVFSSEIKGWIPPVEYPKDGNSYLWDESTVSWSFISAPSWVETIVIPDEE
jgi:hypothetical protein